MNRNIQTQIDRLMPLWTATDEILGDWKGEGCLQLPSLMLQLAVKLNWNDKQVRENDPFVRAYLRNHEDWHVTRGAGGGIMRRSDKDKKDAERAAKDLARKQVEEDIALKAQKLYAAQAAATLAVDTVDEVEADEESEETVA